MQGGAPQPSGASASASMGSGSTASVETPTLDTSLIRDTLNQTQKKAKKEIAHVDSMIDLSQANARQVHIQNKQLESKSAAIKEAAEYEKEVKQFKRANNFHKFDAAADVVRQLFNGGNSAFDFSQKFKKSRKRTGIQFD